MADTKVEFKSWSLEITDENGLLQTFGPYTQSRVTISGNKILRDRPTGIYKVVMVGEAKNGQTVRKVSSVRLVRKDPPVIEALRFSILFDFDKSTTMAKYEKFLAEIVAPLVPDSSTIVIHGHTDIIGGEEYNMNLSYERAMEAQRLLNNALKKAGKNHVKFESLGFGEDEEYAPFENEYPEQRFYNRSVIIDIVPAR